MAINKSRTGNHLILTYTSTPKTIEAITTNRIPNLTSRLERWEKNQLKINETITKPRIR